MKLLVLGRWPDLEFSALESGVATGLDLDRVLEAAAVVERAVGHALPSGLYRTGGPSRRIPRPV